MNKVIIFGRLTRDPESKQTQSGKMMTDFAIAVNRQGGNNGEQAADFFDIRAFDKQAELIANSCKKGQRLLVEGRMQQDRWTDQQTQQQRTSWRVMLNNFEFIEPREQSQQPQQGYQPPTQSPAYGAPSQQPYGQPGGYQPPAQPQGYPQPPVAPPYPSQGVQQPPAHANNQQPPMQQQGYQPPAQQQYGAPPQQPQPPAAPQNYSNQQQPPAPAAAPWS